MAHATAIKKGTFLEEVIEATPNGERLLHCMQCGSCGGSCPSGGGHGIHAPGDLRHDSGRRARRRCWRPTRNGRASPATSAPPAARRISRSPISCTRSSGSPSPKARFHGTSAPALAKTFTDLVEKYGRSFELGLGQQVLPAEPADRDAEDGPDGRPDVHPRPHVAHAHENQEDRPVAGDHQEGERTEREEVEAKWPVASGQWQE